MHACLVLSVDTHRPYPAEDKHASKGTSQQTRAVKGGQPVGSAQQPSKVRQYCKPQCQPISAQLVSGCRYRLPTCLYTLLTESMHACQSLSVGTHTRPYPAENKQYWLNPKPLSHANPVNPYPRHIRHTPSIPSVKQHKNRHSKRTGTT